MPIRFYETSARKIVPFEPREDGKVGMYACGPTVYNYMHIGNARTTIWYDFIRRYLTYRGNDVTYVMNYTDVDDKIIERAKVEGLPAEGVARKYTRAFEEDLTALGAEPADLLVRATDHIKDMVEAIQGLIDGGFAYESSGDVYFAVDKFPAYGKLSRRTVDDMRAGERVDVSEHKRHPLDFTLWKAAKEGEPSWPSPWGPGRPGWHIECSVMSTKYLGMGFDIHGGGADLIFPHHENEIAQAEALAGEEPFVTYWVHAGLVQMESEKMSKSLGNFVLTREVLEQFPGEVVRYWALSSSYRSQAVFSDEALVDSTNAYERWKTFSESARHALGEDAPRRPADPRRPDPKRAASGEHQGPVGAEFLDRFVEAMDDDFNSPEAFAVVHDLVRVANKCIPGAQRGDEDDRAALSALVQAFDELMMVLNFRFPAGAEDLKLVGGLVEYLLELRSQAREDKAFDRADAIRARLAELGVAIEDTPAGPRWHLT
jgi:cysteinyl-tRNA synthetase